jgi:hypothetical protein
MPSTATVEAGGNVGEVGARVLRRLGVVRISLPAVPYVESEATDRVLGGPPGTERGRAGLRPRRGTTECSDVQVAK